MAIDAVFSVWDRNPRSRTVVVAPTGSGKTLMISELIRRFLSGGRRAQNRAVVLAHRSELLSQNARAIVGYLGWSEDEVGLFSASLGRKDSDRKIMVCGIQSAGKCHDVIAENGPIGLIVIDEAHLVPNNENTLYRRFLDDAMRANPDVRICGMTATPYRLDSGLLYEGKDALFDSLAYEIEIPLLIERGYLCPVISKGGIKTIDVSSVHIRGGEYRADELAHAANDDRLVGEAVEEIVRIGEADHRKGWMLFASGVDHARNLLSKLAAHGVASDIVTGETDHDVRQGIVAAYKTQKLKALVNVNVLTTGFDAPHTDLIAMLRPTKSTSLYIQSVGRGMRIFPGKENCLFLDYAGVVMEHGLIDQVDPKRNGSWTGDDAPAKRCPACSAFVPTATRRCPFCGHTWPAKEVIHDTRAYSGAILSSQGGFRILDVRSKSMQVWSKPGKPKTVRIVYHCADGKKYSEWICPEHVGYPRTLFERRCRDEWGMIPSEFPRAAQDVVDRQFHLPTPSRIKVILREDSPWAEIKKRVYDDEIPF